MSDVTFVPGREAATGVYADMPCLACPTCRHTATIGGHRYMDANHTAAPGGWSVQRCTCPPDLNNDPLALD